jgi:succinate dehydrogenase / fumarate reductase flavoprotein subunit
VSPSCRLLPRVWRDTLEGEPVAGERENLIDRPALVRALEVMAREIGETPMRGVDKFDTVLLDWLDLRNMLLVARAVTTPAIARTESRGAHQREDFERMDERWTVNQVLTLAGDRLALERVAPNSRKQAA